MVEFNFKTPKSGESHIHTASEMPKEFSSLLLNCHVSLDGDVSKNKGYKRINTARLDFTITGTVAVTNISSVLTGTGTLFLTDLKVGKVVVIASVEYTILTITSDTLANLSINYIGATASGLSITTPVRFHSGFEYRKKDGTVIKLVAGNGSIYTVGTTLTAIQTGMDKTAKVYFATMNDVCVWGNGVSGDGPKKFDGTTVSPIGSLGTGTVSVTNGSTAVVGVGTLFTTELTVGDTVLINDKVVIIQTITDTLNIVLTATFAGLTGTGLTYYMQVPPETSFRPHNHRGRLWWLERTDKLLASYSGLNNLNDYSIINDAGFLDFASNLPSADEFVDLTSRDDFIIFFFKNHVSVYQGFGPTDLTLFQLIKGSGMIITGVVEQFGNDVIYLYNGVVASIKRASSFSNLTTGDFSKEIQPEIVNSINDFGSDSRNFSIAHFQERSWILFHMGTTTWVYNYVAKAWGRIKEADIETLFSSIDGSVFIGGSGFVYTYGTGFDFDGVDIFIRYETSWTNPKKGKRLYPKILNALMNSEPGITTGNPTEISVEIDFNTNVIGETRKFMTGIQPSRLGEAVDGIWEDSIILSKIKDEPKRVALFGSGNSFQLALYNRSSEGPIDFTELIVETDIGGV